MEPRDGSVDPWSHFLGAFVLDRDGYRVARRNAEDIFTPLYNHGIPPGAADVIHYRLEVPADAQGSVTFEARLRYRKFDTEYMRFVMDDPAYANDLPILELASDAITFPIVGGEAIEVEAPDIPEWQRWNDYGIGLLRKRGTGQLRQAEVAFQRVEELGRPDGPINLARVYLREGRVARDAPEALRRAAAFDPPAREWSVLWFTGLVNKQNGNFDAAIANFEQIVEGGFAQAKGRGFDFSKDYRLLVELGNTVYQRARQERGERRRDGRERMLREAAGWLEAALEIDPENAAAHYNLELVYADLGDEERSRRHGELHALYKPDDNAADRAIAAARKRYPAADVASEAVVIYDLHRAGAPGMDGEAEER
jgi:tetratricopeptide (TPR) repeat protein